MMGVPTLTRASDPTPEQQRQAEALVAAVVAAYLLTSGQVKAMAAAILTARLASLAAAYTDAANTVNALLPATGYQPPDDETRAQRDTADAHADSIAATYQRDAAATATAFILAWLAQHADEEAPLAGARDALRAHLSDWAAQRAVWKASQVAQDETSSAAHDGTQAAVSDLTDGTLTDESGAAFDTSQLLVAVLPAESSSDFCAAYAGNTYAFDDAPALDFPAHSGCVHYVVVLSPDGSEEDA